MKLNRRRINLLLVFIYVISAIYAFYILFTLEEGLVYDSQSIQFEALQNAKPVLNTLYLSISLSLLLGIGVLLSMFSNKNMDVIYVEKKDDKNANISNDNKNEDEKKAFDISSIKDALSEKTKSEEKIINQGLNEICKTLEAGVGAFYQLKKDSSKNVLQMNSTYAMSLGESQRPTYELGEGLVGQVGAELKPIIIDDIPEGYIKVVSGLGSASPTHILITPVLVSGKLFGVVEIASFTKLDKDHLKAVDESFQLVTNKLFASDEAKPKKTVKKDSQKGNKET